MQLRYNYRLYPTPGQQQALARAFGCARVVFNDGLRARQEAHAAGLPYLTGAELSARLTAAKTTPERPWLGEVSAVVLQQSLADLGHRIPELLRVGHRESGKARRSRRPGSSPARITGRRSGSTANARFRVLANGKLRLPKIGDVPVRWSRALPPVPSSVTVIRDSAGRYFA